MSNIDTQHIWNAFSHNLRQFLVRQVACSQDADDLLQEIFIKIHLKHHTLSKEESLPAWVWQLTRNTLLDYHKKSRLPQTSLENTEWIASESNSLEINHLFADCIRPYLELLPAAQREALQLADLENISQKHLAEKWGIAILEPKAGCNAPGLNCMVCSSNVVRLNQMHTATSFLWNAGKSRGGVGVF